MISVEFDIVNTILPVILRFLYLQSMRMQTEVELKMFKQNEYVYHTMRDAALKTQPMGSSSSADEKIKGLFHKQ